MGEGAYEQARASEPQSNKAAREASPATARVVDPLLSSLSKEHRLDGPKDDARASSEIEHRVGLITQFGMLQGSLISAVSDGIERGLSAITVPEVKPRNDTAEFLAFAASLALAGSAGAVAVAVGSAIADKFAKKFVEDGVKEAIKQAFKGHVSGSRPSLAKLWVAYEDQLKDQLAIARFELAARWSKVNDRLSSLSTADLERAVSSPVDLHSVPAILDTVADQTVIAWTNFLARAVHGGMRAWDPWSGPPTGIALQGASQSTERDPHVSNVDPRGLDDALALNQGANFEECYGVLEVYLSSGGNFLNKPGYGLRLKNVGPEVRERLRRFGTVRALPINKIVRVCDKSISPPIPVESLLITADGRIQEYRRGLSQLVHRDRSMDMGECLDRLVEGRQNAACHVDRNANEAAVVDYAEVAQSLSLSLLQD